MLPDIVYVVGGDSAELRYSLRSLRNLPHGDVIIAGDPPNWTRDVCLVPVVQDGEKWANQEANLRAALELAGDRFLLFNDDFWIMDPLDAVPVWHRGLFADHAKKLAKHTANEHVLRLRHTRNLCGPNGLVYDGIHTPLPMRRDEARETMAHLPRRTLFRSVYGNRWGLGGTEHADVKITGKRPLHDAPIWSASDRRWREDVGEAVAARFPEPGIYEEAAA